jgi:hypothetical protein
MLDVRTLSGAPEIASAAGTALGPGPGRPATFTVTLADGGLRGYGLVESRAAKVKVTGPLWPGAGV